MIIISNHLFGSELILSSQLCSFTILSIIDNQIPSQESFVLFLDFSTL